MKFHAALLLSASLSLLGCEQVSSLLATVRGDGDIYPLAKGNQWKYDVFVDSEKTFTEVDEVLDVSKSDGVTTATIKVTRTPVSGQEISVNQVMRKSSDEILQGPEDGPSYPILKLPLTVGKTWTVTSVPMTVMGREDVTVTAGKYGACYRVGIGASPATFSNWYAPGVGLVKSEGTLNGKTARQDLISVTLK